MTQHNKKSFFKYIFKIAFIPFAFTLVMLLVYILEIGMEWDFAKAGIYPRKVDWLWTIFSYIFIHANWSHLFNNLLSFSA
jgi:membrane associated rhomboid family serine protease